MVSQPIRLILVDGSSSISFYFRLSFILFFFLGRLPFFLRSSPIFKKKLRSASFFQGRHYCFSIKNSGLFIFLFLGQNKVVYRKSAS
jgi:hypothetical protein